MLSASKTFVFHCLRLWFRCFSTDYTTTLPEGPALIIAPHPDDETIGCGASLARFCAEGRKVRVVIVTDGRASTQSAIITPDELSVIRRTEALNATQKLGLSEDHVFFLSYPDGAVVHHMDAISEAIASHIAQFAPAIVFAPHPFDEHEDHRVTAYIVGQLHTPLVLHYPIWYGIRSWPYGVLRCLLSLSMYKTCRHICAAAYSPQKNAALLLYHSQFANLTGETSWRYFPAASRKRFSASVELFFEGFTTQRLKKLS